VTPDATAAQEMETLFPPDLCPGMTGNQPVVLATDETDADALSSAYLAKDLGTATLLTPTGSLSAPTAAALKREGITHVDVVGGPLAVSTTVVASLEATPAYACGGTRALGKDLTVTRIAGATAATTAADVAGTVGKAFVGAADLAGAYGGNGKDNATTGASSPAPSAPGVLPTAIVASGREFQDAEGGSVLSYADDLPILLTTSGSVPAATTRALGALGVRQVIVLGGPLAVSTAVVSTLEADGVSVLRVAGLDDTGTAVELAELETASTGTHAGFGWDAHHPGLAVARGNGFQDGLAGAALAAHGVHGSGPLPLLLTRGADDGRLGPRPVPSTRRRTRDREPAHAGLVPRGLRRPQGGDRVGRPDDAAGAVGNRAGARPRSGLRLPGPRDLGLAEHRSGDPGLSPDRVVDPAPLAVAARDLDEVPFEGSLVGRRGERGEGSFEVATLLQQVELVDAARRAEVLVDALDLLSDRLRRAASTGPTRAGVDGLEVPPHDPGLFATTCELRLVRSGEAPFGSAPRRRGLGDLLGRDRPCADLLLRGARRRGRRCRACFAGWHGVSVLTCGATCQI
jgi:putative cell wall-binding protein